MQSSIVAADPALQRVLSTTTAAVGAIRDGAVAGQHIEELKADLEAVRRAQAQLDWVALQLVREVDTGGGHVADGALTTHSWLRQTVRMSPSEASTAVRTARGLGAGSLDATSAALAAGEIDLAHARLIAKDCAEAPAGAVGLIEPLALAAARESAPGQVAEVMRGFTHALDPDAADEAAVRRYEQRGLSAATTLGGMVAGRFLRPGRRVGVADRDRRRRAAGGRRQAHRAAATGRAGAPPPGPGSAPTTPPAGVSEPSSRASPTPE